jgi:hypothetical protein
MTKRISQPATVVVPVAEAHSAEGEAAVAAPATEAVAVADAAEATVDVAAADQVDALVEDDGIIALVAPVPLSMMSESTAAAAHGGAAAAAQAESSDDGGGSNSMPYIAGGVLLAGGVIAAAASGGGKDDVVAPPPPPPPPPANTAPTITSAATASTPENVATTVAVVTVKATDAQGQAITYSIGGADAALFNISATTGAVTFKASPDFEAVPTKTSFTFTVTATDSAGAASAPQTVTLTLTDVNEAPKFASGTTTLTIDENVAAGTALTGLSNATDPDAGAVLTYSLSGTDAAAFAVNPTTGAVTLVASPDFETKSAYSFNLVVTDQGGLNATQTVTLNIHDLPEATLVHLDGAGVPATTNVDYDAGAGATIYIDAGAAGNISTITHFGTDDLIQTDTAASEYAFTSIGTDLIIAHTDASGAISRIILTGAVSSDAGVFNEVSAEQAVGFDFFHSSVTPPPPPPPPPAGTMSLDTAASPVDASTSAFTFTDSATAPNNVTINNFTNDDKIVLTGATSGAAFTSLGTDLIVSFTNPDSGVISRITITNVVSSDAGIFTEASAEAAIGFDFFQYG